jgi:hypothetical protein
LESRAARGRGFLLVKDISTGRNSPFLQVREYFGSPSSIFLQVKKYDNGISQQAFYLWKKYAGLELSELRQLREGNAKLKRLMAALSLDRRILQDIVKLNQDYIDYVSARRQRFIILQTVLSLVIPHQRGGGERLRDSRSKFQVH